MEFKVTVPEDLILDNTKEILSLFVSQDNSGSDISYMINEYNTTGEHKIHAVELCSVDYLEEDDDYSSIDAQYHLLSKKIEELQAIKKDMEDRLDMSEYKEPKKPVYGWGLVYA